MVVNNEREALCVAIEMERRAIRLYERALMLVENEAVHKGIECILKQERMHLKRFMEMQERYPADVQEEKTLMQAMGAEALFPGGVMEMERSKGLTTLESLYSFAAESEQQAVETYLAFGEKCRDDNIGDAFRAIAAEESKHVISFQEHVNNLRR